MSKSIQRPAVQRCLDIVERVGNRLPDPLTLFAIFCLMVIVISAIASALGVSVTHPADGRVIAAENLLSAANIRRMFTDMVKNFASFPPLGMVLVTMIGIGLAERSGVVTTALKKLVTYVPKFLLPATLVFAGIMSSMVADAGYVVLTPLGAVLFAGFGRHPLAGLAAAFAGVSAGFSANLLLTSLDPLLAGLSTTAAHTVDPAYTVHSAANYYFMIFSTFFLTIAGSVVTTKIVEPRLGKWNPSNEAFGGLDHSLGEIRPIERKGLWVAGAVFALCSLAILYMGFSENAILRDPEHGLKPFYESLVPLIMVTFFLVGLAYGIVVKTIRSDRDVAKLTADSMASLGGYIVLAFISAQFVAYFSWSNLGVITAITGAGALQSVGFTGIPLVIAFIIVAAFINVFIGSASAKWAVMGPVFIPMMMLMGYSPELVQAAYRVGDSVTNIITPLLPYFPLIIAFARRYEPKTGIGTLISIMLPYSITFGIFWTISFIIWIAFGIPLGPDSPLYYQPG